MNKPNKGSFKKGHKTWNKGLKGLSYPGSVPTQFNPCESHEHISWKGGIHKPKNDCVHVHTGKNQRVRRPRAVYEHHYGKIPKGFVVVHKDYDRHNDAIENLMCISRADNMRRNGPTHKDNNV